MSGERARTLDLGPRLQRMRAAPAWRRWPPPPRRHNLVLAAIVLPAVLALVAVALVQQPLRGDLTRPGGYSEYLYGWNAPQARFVPPLAALAYDRPYDIVIVGDSFSNNPGGGQTDPGAYWPNHLAQMTGLSVVSLNMFHFKLAELPDHPVFRASPPRLVVVQTVERYLTRDHAAEVDRWMGPCARSCPPGAPAPPPVPLALRPLPVEPVEWRRDLRPAVDLDQATDYLWKQLQRSVLGRDTTPVVRVALTRDAPLSSRVRDHLLVYNDELDKPRTWTAPLLDRAHCNLRDAQRRIEANGRTHFAYMPVPDKLTAYAELVAAPNLAALSQLPAFAARPGLRVVDLTARLRHAVRCGVPDLYLPNDTHWGTAAHRIAAAATIDTFLGRAWTPGPCPAPARAAALRP